MTTSVTAIDSGRRRSGHLQLAAAEAVPVCDREPYPRYPPGKYEAPCLNAKTMYLPHLRSWKCKLDFVMWWEDRPVTISAFLHLGNDEKPKAGRHSQYRRLWVQANRAAPKTRQVLSDRVFKGKAMRIQVRNVERRFDGQTHAPGDIYSVADVVDVIGP
jgi:hypothetical protein